MTTIDADPRSRRQIGSDRLWLFWRDGPGGRGRQGLALDLEMCMNAECPCTEVEVLGQTCDERAHQVEFDGKRLAFIIERSLLAEAELTHGLAAQSVHARIDFVTGEVRPGGEADHAPDELLAWLRSEADVEVLDGLHRIWVERRRYRAPAAARHYEGWEPGVFLWFGEAFPLERRDGFRVGGKTYVLEDLYCVTPGCDCQRVIVVWGELEPQEAYRNGAGGVTSRSVDRGAFDIVLPSLEPVDWRLEKMPRAEQIELWTRFQERHADAAKLLAARRRRMRAEVRPLPAPVPPRAPKVGRNDPCPCGSGKKSKRCCGGLAATSEL